MDKFSLRFGSQLRSTRRRAGVVAMALVVSALATSPALAVRVAMVKGFPRGEVSLPILSELIDHWDRYGETRVIIDQSLVEVATFDYNDLVATGADVLWISSPAGALQQYSPAEIAAVAQYASEGHHVFGTFRTFRFDSFDNRALAPVFGLPEASYNIGSITSDLAFGLINGEHPIFKGVSDPYVSMGFNRAQVPNDDGSWDAGDFGAATLMAVTDDEHGVITLFKTETYHAVYCSLFVEFLDDPVEAADTQFIYNVLTLDATPTGTCCAGNGRCDVVEEVECAEDWSQGGVCDPNPCPQLGGCCGLKGSCSIGFEIDCPTDRWVEGVDCVSDDDGDGVIDACDTCPGFDDNADDDGDFVPDGCDRCPGFNDALDADGDGAPDACDVCPGFDDRVDDDGDGVPDGCDVCAGFDDALDCDGNEIPNGCELEPDCNRNTLPDNCDIDNGSKDCDTNGVPDECQRDDDDDGIIDPCDKCIGDDALIGAACDSAVDVDDCRSGTFGCDTGILTCSDDDEPDDVDSDGDGVFDCNDLCAGTPPGVIVLPDGCRPEGACCLPASVCFNAVPPEDCTAIGGVLLGIGLVCNGDADEDGAVGCDDGCPLDPTKATPGQCGCGTPDDDSDSDGTADCVDLCPNDQDKIEPGICGCGLSDDDSDGDGTIDCKDACPDDPDKIGPGVCGCGVADVDSDNDETVDCQDGCPNDPGKIEPGVCGCGVPDVDSDDDGTFDCGDECPNDAAKTTPGECGCGVIEDVTDNDNDGVIACVDDCPGTMPDTIVDENGCPMTGACCFTAGGGICVNDTEFVACAIVNGRYQGNGTSCAGGCAFPTDGDVNADGVIDLTDYPFFTDCMNGPDLPIGAGNCGAFDVDPSDTVDLGDFAKIQVMFGAP